MTEAFLKTSEDARFSEFCEACRVSKYIGLCYGAPGVGKTYAMLQAAQAKMNDGVDVVVGVVETHGRRETEVLLKGFELVPRLRAE